MKYLPLLILCLSLTACSTLPPAIENPPAVDISYSQATGDIAHYRKYPVRWGGVIIDVLNEQSFSRLQVIAYPLNSYGRPVRDKPPQGRFYIYSNTFLDPAIYEKDKEVTAAGVLKGDEALMVGKKNLRLPALQATTLHLWPQYERMPYYYNGGFGPGGFYPYPGYYGYPYFWGGYYGYYPRY
ncbi:MULTISPECIES: Slp family lipoprotein [Methylomicrobium]|uniref:Starvation-inducible outer membrane lipoprotein n=1 Tax=Methylomicrobium album BG8 TaxID=686340 RepID=H8GQP2_METAL|nr:MULTISPECIES: Slp family lipoprotein [Methylomicrobium]EIC31027.1 starvation-inducible outer membrane lipoprotein [Methylomicrobium album BG8]